MDSSHLGFLHYGKLRGTDFSDSESQRYTAANRAPEYFTKTTDWGFMYAAVRGGMDDQLNVRVSQFVLPFWTMPPLNPIERNFVARASAARPSPASRASPSRISRSPTAWATSSIARSSTWPRATGRSLRPGGPGGCRGCARRLFHVPKAAAPSGRWLDLYREQLARAPFAAQDAPGAQAAE